MKIREFIKDKPVSELEVLASMDFDVEIEDMLPIIDEGSKLRREKGEKLKTQSGSSYDNSYEGSILLYSLIGKLRKENVQDEIIKIFKDSNKKYLEYFSTYNDYNSELKELNSIHLKNDLIN